MVQRLGAGVMVRLAALLRVGPPADRAAAPHRLALGRMGRREVEAEVRITEFSAISKTDQARDGKSRAFPSRNLFYTTLDPHSALRTWGPAMLEP